MSTFRPDLEAIPRYVPGKPIDEVARDYGIESIDKLASNECPDPPFPEVVEAIARASTSINRYPDSSCHELTKVVADHLHLPEAALWFGAGSSEILRCTALSVGGPGTSAVFAHPSFVMYTISTLVAHSEAITVPLADHHEHDLDAMLAAIRDDTTIVYVCNPNNPTGGIRSGDDVAAFLDEVPERVTVVVDEAYAEYVTDESWRTMIDISRPNLLVARTFSKIYGLAGLRIGYAIGAPPLIDRLRGTQPPFSVSTVAQTAAIAAVGLGNRVAERRDENAKGRNVLVDGLSARGIEPSPSQTNFVYFEPPSDPAELAESLLRRGVIVRALGPGIRVTVGTAAENARFFDAWDDVVAHA